MSKLVDTTQEAQEANATKSTLIRCRVLVDCLELPHGIAAKDAIVHLPEVDFKHHENAGNVKYIQTIE